METENDRLFPFEAWHELTEYDDRTSPAEYPDMALITFDELASFMARAHPNECTCCDVVGENPDCIVHGSLSQEVDGLETERDRLQAELAAEREKGAGLVQALRGCLHYATDGAQGACLSKIARLASTELAKHKEGGE